MVRDQKVEKDWDVARELTPNAVEKVVAAVVAEVRKANRRMNLRILMNQVKQLISNVKKSKEINTEGMFPIEQEWKPVKA
ncbi:hypothetical protein DOZ58_13690 [Acetobacterium sp. KB-1]|jgi:hypothetical protein|nr:hypothetical protein DOZ58_13690 [Acetobacterium sp. KB-1]